MSIIPLFLTYLISLPIITSIQPDDTLKTYTLDQIPYKRILGRNVKDAGTTSAPLALFWGASGLELSFKSTEIWINFSSNYTTHESWVAIEINGAPISRFSVPKESTWYCVSRQLDIEKQNTITIYKDTQAMSGDDLHLLFINSVAISVNGEFLPLEKKSLKIEIVGDSITSGEGLAGDIDEWDWIPQWFCASKTYAVQTAKNLNAELSVVSQCGWGVCWAWDGNLNNKIPPHYENVCSLLYGDYQKSFGAKDNYEFNGGYDFVVVNLGTNDNGAFFQKAWKDEDGVEHELKRDENGKADKEGGEKFANGVYDFLKVIRKNNPEAKIIWMHGMININSIYDYLVEAVEKYQKETSDKNVYILKVDDMNLVETLPEDKGSRGHPGPTTHKKAAEKLTKFIQSLF